MASTIFQSAAVCSPQSPKIRTHDIRRLGWRKNYSDLREDIDRAGSELIEARWDYLVIEEVLEGIWPSTVDAPPIWLCWNDTLRKWIPTKQPSWAVGTIHWTF